MFARMGNNCSLLILRAIRLICEPLGTLERHVSSYLRSFAPARASRQSAIKINYPCDGAGRNVKRSAKIAGVGGSLAAAVVCLIILAIPGIARRGALRMVATSQPASAPDQTYSVTMSPMGTVTFSHIPKRIVTLDANYNDMLVALGRPQHLVATGYANNRYDGFYQELSLGDAVIDYDQIFYLCNGSESLFDKEVLYALHADVHHIDPLQLAKSRGWSEADVEEVSRNVAPFFANRYSRTNDYSGPHQYDYYTVWELSDKVSQVYRQSQRIARLKEVYDQMLGAIRAKLPPPDRRPRVGLVMYSETGFLPYTMAAGFGAEQYRAVGAVDAFGDVPHMTFKEHGGGARLDLEGMLSIDPDVLITPFAVLPGMRPNHDRLLTLRSDALGKRLKAVRNNHVYPGGTPLQGPLFLLFQVEMAAKQIYPERFGQYRDDQLYPNGEQLFDRARVADILNDKAGGDGQ